MVAALPLASWPRTGKPKLGKIYRDCPHELYHSLPGLSSSRLPVIAKAPALAKDPEPSEETKAQFRGTLMHCLLREPEQYESRYRYAGSIDLRTYGTDEWHQDVESERRANGRILFRNQDLDWDFDRLWALVARAREHRAVRELLDSCGTLYTEHAYWWRDRETGIVSKAKPDDFGIDGRRGLVVDLKTRRTAAIEPFGRELWYDLLDARLAHYARGLTEITGVEDIDLSWIVLDESGGIGVYLYGPEDPEWAWAFERRDRIMKMWLEAESSGHFPNYNGDEIAKPVLPRAAYWQAKRGTYGLVPEAFDEEQTEGDAPAVIQF